MAFDPLRQARFRVAAEPLTFLQAWYWDQCDGDWEHGCGVTIGTLDNPGWWVEINLCGTELEGRGLDRVEVRRTEHDWFDVWSDGLQFQAASGPGNLGEALEAFRRFVNGT